MFDSAFGPEVPQQDVYKECVEPLVDATFEGIHGTLLAYGQTGSGKTYTMGTSGLPSVPAGALQLAIHDIFQRSEEMSDEEGVTTRFRVSYVEIFTDSRPAVSGKGTVCTEEVRDLLAPGRPQFFATVRVDMDGQVRLEGVGEHEVCSEREALALLAVGSMSRSTSATRMNDNSSRSHALFCIEVIQRRQRPAPPGASPGASAGALTITAAKFMFVDLAGSEKVKLSGAEGEQLSQAININHGLFVLGKVITALTDGQAHVPFRESKLTRILQNSLGGNSKTCMIACVSPADANIAETISTLKYAAKAKEIKNKPIVNQLHDCQNCAALQAQIRELEKQGRSAQSPFIQQDFMHRCVTQLEKENRQLREENARLQRQLSGHGILTVSASSNPSSVSISPLASVGAEAASAGAAPGGAEASAAANAAVDAEKKAARFEALFRRCSERLAALKQAVRTSEAASIDEELLEPDSEQDMLEDLAGGAPTSPATCLGSPLGAIHEHDVRGGDGFGGAGRDGDHGREEGGHEEDDADDEDVAWLDQEARRKERLMLQVEENHHAMAVLEQQSSERLRQHEAARDIAERELARLQTELHAARSREEHLEALQSRYDRRLEALKERNGALGREQKEQNRLKTIMRQQETRLKVLQDSIRNVSEERNKLKRILEGEIKKRLDSEAQGRKENRAAQQRIRSLSKRVAVLEKTSTASSSGYDTDASTSSTRTSFQRRSSSRFSVGGSGSARSPAAARRISSSSSTGLPTTAPGAGDGDSPGTSSRTSLSTASRAAGTAGSGAAGSVGDRPSGSTGVAVWEQLLHRAAQAALRERRLEEVVASFEVSEAKALESVARRDRLSVRSEVEGPEDVAAELAAAEAEAEVLSTALEYQREQVWLARKERDACPDFDLREAARRLADGMENADLAQALCWLVAEAHRQRAGAMASGEARDASEAEVAAIRATLAESEHRAAEQEQAFDLARSDYESRVAYLVQRLNSEGRVELQELQDAIGEETVTFLTRRIAELEEGIERQREEAKDRQYKRLEQDMQLISKCREQEGQVHLLRTQVGEADAKADRAIMRSAQREAQLLQQVRKLEERLQAAEKEAASSEATSSAAGAAAESSPSRRGSASVEVSWGLDLLEEFWRSTGLDDNRDELLRGLREDVEHLCEQRLKDHLRWKEELERRAEELRSGVRGLAEQLSEEVEWPPEGANLLQVTRMLETQFAALTELHDSRSRELGDALERLEATHVRLHGDGFEGALWPPEFPRRLHRQTLASVRARLLELESIEREREALVTEEVAELRSLWYLLGVRVPEELDEREAELLKDPPPVTDTALSSAGECRGRLQRRKGELEAEVADTSEELEAWLRLLAQFDVEELPMPVPDEGPLLQRLEVAQAAAAQVQETARNFAQRERAALTEFLRNTRLTSVASICDELRLIDPRRGLEATAEELRILGGHWEQLSLQREEYRRVRELVVAREALEAEMREFDAEASDPSRFKRRGYSGVQENRRRSEHQRRLRGLDGAISAGTDEWLLREGMLFCMEGKEYRGPEMLPSEHTHMYAWTGKQMAQKEAVRAGLEPSSFNPLSRIQPGQAPAGPVSQLRSSAAQASGSGAAAGPSRAHRRRTLGGEELHQTLAFSPRESGTAAKMTSPRDIGKASQRDPAKRPAIRRRSLD